MLSLLLAAVLASPPPPVPGEEVEIRVPTSGSVVSLAADVVVSASVTGHVVAVAGNVVLQGDARVSGDVVALGGRVIGDGQVDGRVVSLAGLGLPVGSAGPRGRVGWTEVALRLTWVGGWLVVANLVLLMLPRPARKSGELLARFPVRSIAVGGAFLAAGLAVLVVALALSQSLPGVFLFAAVLVALLALKVVGLVGVAWVFGRWLAPRLPGALRGEAARTGVAVLGLCLLGSLPWVGPLAWTAINVAAVGAAATLLFQRRPVLAAVPVPGLR